MQFNTNARIFAMIGLLAISAIAGPVSYYGKLKSSGGNVMDASGTHIVQLKGPSLYWSTLEGMDYYDQRTVDWFVDNLDISVIRAAMAIKYWDGGSKLIDQLGNFGYLATSVTNAKELQKEKIRAVIDAAIKNDIYVIVDWHSHVAHNEKSEAVAFFSEMATLYKDCPNIIWEVFNEPLSIDVGTIWSYSNDVITAIRNAGSTNLVFVGSPSWSQQPNAMATISGQQPLHKKFTNVGYSFHFYAKSHPSNGAIASSATSAKSNGAAVFATEWGTTDAEATQAPDANATSGWISFLNTNKIGSCNWSVLALGGTTDIFTSGQPLNANAYSTSGTIFKEFMMTTYGQAPAGYPWGKSRTYNIVEGSGVSISLTDIGATANATFSGVEGLDPALGTATFTANSISFAHAAVAPPQASFNYILDLGGKKSKHRITVNINRKPILRDTIVLVSYLETQKSLSLSSLGARDPDAFTPTISTLGTGNGTIVASADKKSFTYTPVPNYRGTEPFKDDPILVTITDGVTTTSATITFRICNLPPTVYSTRAFTIGNDSVFHISLSMVVAKDFEKVDTTFSTATILNGGYAGTLQISPDKKSLIFTPEPNKIGTLKINYTVSDGESNSTPGVATLTINGLGTIITDAIRGSKMPSNFRLVGMGSSGATLNVEYPGDANVVLYNSMGTQIYQKNFGHLSVGPNRLNWNMDNAPKGLYIAKIRVGATTYSGKFELR